MSLKTEGVSCVRCHAYLFPEDDIVYCPVCGAPHHRECYEQLGHCAMEEFHGTDRQYDIVKAREEERKAAQPEKETVRVLPGFLCGEMSPALFVAAEKTDRLRRVAWKVGFDDLKIMGKRAGFLNAEASVRTGQHRGGNGGHGKTPED